MAQLTAKTEQMKIFAAPMVSSNAALQENVYLVIGCVMVSMIVVTPLTNSCQSALQHQFSILHLQREDQKQKLHLQPPQF